MKLTRTQAIALFGSALALPHCAGSGALRIGSKNFSESITVAEIYAAALEANGFAVDRKMNLGSTQIAMAALQHGDIDLYPEYTGTALIDVLHLPPIRDAKILYNTIVREFSKRYGLAVLGPSPGSNSQGMCVTRAVAKKYHVETLSQCAAAAPQLRLAAVPEFVSRADALPGLQKFYGGFAFKSVRTFTIGLQYEALTRGDADVATAFTTDAQIAAFDLVVLRDDRHFWPPYNIVPIVRMDAMKSRRSELVATLNKFNSRLTDGVLRQFNYNVDMKKADPSEVAEEFVH